MNIKPLTIHDTKQKPKIYTRNGHKVTSIWGLYFSENLYGRIDDILYCFAPNSLGQYKPKANITNFEILDARDIDPLDLMIKNN